MKFNIKKEQKIRGNLISANGSTIHQNVIGICKFNAYYLSESYIYFNIETNWGNYTFEIEPNIKLILSFSKGFYPTYFDISEVHILTGKKNKNNEFESGCLDGLLYFHKEIRYNDIIIKKHLVPEKYTNKNSQYYYSIQSESVTDFESADLIFLILSTITGTKFFSRTLKDKSGKIVYRQRFAERCRIYLIGSGRLIFPIEFSEMMQLKDKVNIDFLKSVLLLYTSFCTSNNIRDRLLMGCSLLDYLLEIYQKIALNVVKRVNKSKLLYQLISEIINDNTKLETYIKKLFKNFPGKL